MVKYHPIFIVGADTTTHGYARFNLLASRTARTHATAALTPPSRKMTPTESALRVTSPSPRGNKTPNLLKALRSNVAFPIDTPGTAPGSTGCRPCESRREVSESIIAKIIDDSPVIRNCGITMKTLCMPKMIPAMSSMLLPPTASRPCESVPSPSSPCSRLMSPRLCWAKELMPNCADKGGSISLLDRLVLEESGSIFAKCTCFAGVPLPFDWSLQRVDGLFSGPSGE